MLHGILIVDDSWREARILYAVKGISILDEKAENNDDSPMSTTLTNNRNNQDLFQMFLKYKTTHEKRAYQYVKMLCRLFTEYVELFYDRFCFYLLHILS